MFVTHLQGPHQSVCWLRPKRARHFLGEPGSEYNAQHAQNKEEEERQKQRNRRRGRLESRDEDGKERREINKRNEETQELIRAGKGTNRAVRTERAIKSNC